MQVYRVVGFQVETNSIDKSRISIGQDGASCSIKDEAAFQVSTVIPLFMVQ